MKKALKIVAILVVVVLIVAIALPFVIPTETYTRRMEAAVADATGRELAINGNVRLSLLPRLELEAHEVTFADAPGAAQPHMATLDELVVQLQLWPLLSGEVRVDSFVLVEPVIHLSVDDAGRGNWEFTAPTPTSAGAPQPAEGGAPAARPPAALTELSLGDVRLERGRITYADARTDTTYDLSQVNLGVSLPGLDQPFAADGAVTWNGKPVTLKVTAAKTRDVLEGDPTDVAVEVACDVLALSYTGTAVGPTPVKADGAVKVTTPSVRDLAAWVGTPLDLPGTGLGPLAIDGNVSVNGSVVAFREAKLQLDDIAATGEVGLDASGPKPHVRGRLDVERLDLNPYLPPEKKKKGKKKRAAEEQKAQQAAEPSDWSDDPIDLSPLGILNADFALTVGSMQVREVKFGRTAMDVALADSVLTADLRELEMYDGQGEARLTVNASGSVPTVEQTLLVQEIQAEPLLTDAADFDRLSGTGRVRLNVTTSGRTQRELVQGLNGKGKVKFVDGAVKGVNLAGMVRNIQSAFTPDAQVEEQKTDFAELSGTFIITNGVVTNDDLVLLNPLLRLKGKGTVHMPDRTVNYRLVPRAVATIEGQGGERDRGGLAVPIIITGSWDNVKYAPDLAGVVTETITDPGQLIGDRGEDSVDGLKDAGEQTVEEIIKGGEETLDQLKGLFGK